MRYTYAEMHLHTAETSRCADVSASDSIPAFKERGYDLVCVTDHYNASYFPADCASPEKWRAAADKWCAGWYAAREAAEKCGMAVIHGAEFKLSGFTYEMLVYGLTDEMILGIPEMYRMTEEEFDSFARENDLFVTLAHPYRHDDRPDRVIFSGAEIFNGTEWYHEDGRTTNDHNILAARYAADNGLIPTCGQDFHEKWEYHGSRTRFHGEVRDVRTMIDKLRAREFDLMLPGGVTVGANASADELANAVNIPEIYPKGDMA